MKITELALAGVLLLEPVTHRDDRGSFTELHQRERYSRAGIDVDFLQDNLSLSRRGVLRGLHFQNPHPQGKLVTVLAGVTFSVAVDLRRGSNTFGRWVSVELSRESGRQLWVPPGFAHGFVAMADEVMMLYKVCGPWRPECERTLRWDDPDVAVEWPVETPTLSAKDAAGLTLRELEAHLFD